MFVLGVGANSTRFSTPYTPSVDRTDSHVTAKNKHRVLQKFTAGCVLNKSNG